MKILHIIPSSAPEHGGPATAIQEICHHQVSKGHSVEVFTTALQASTEDKNGFKIHHFKREFPYNYFYSSSLKTALSEKVSNFDILHIHTLWLYPTWIGSQLALKHKIPYIVRPCGMLDQYCLNQKKLKKYLYGMLRERKVLNHAQSIHFTSVFEQNEAKRFGISRPSNICPLGITVNDDTSPQASPLFPELKEKQNILFLGRLNPIKGLDLLIKAFAQIAQGHPKAHLVLAGPDENNYKKSLLSLIQKFDLIDRVTFTGMLNASEKKALYRQSQIFCLPSYHESFSITCLEAMNESLPVILSDQVGIGDSVEKGNAGIIVPCKEDSLALAIRKLLDSKDLRKNMGGNASTLTQNYFSWDKAITAMDEMYQAALNQVSTHA